jgi:hypothetical protein
MINFERRNQSKGGCGDPKGPEESEATEEIWNRSFLISGTLGNAPSEYGMWYPEEFERSSRTSMPRTARYLKENMKEP